MGVTSTCSCNGQTLVDMVKAPTQLRNYGFLIYTIFNVVYSLFCFIWIITTLSVSFGLIWLFGIGIPLLFVFGYTWRILLIGHIYIMKFFMISSREPKINVPRIKVNTSESKGFLEHVEAVVTDPTTTLAATFLVVINFLVTWFIAIGFIVLLSLVLLPIQMIVLNLTCKGDDCPTGFLRSGWSEIVLVPAGILAFFLTCIYSQYVGYAYKRMNINVLGLEMEEGTALLRLNADPSNFQHEEGTTILFTYLPNFYLSEVPVAFRKDIAFRRHAIVLGIITFITLVGWAISDFITEVYPWFIFIATPAAMMITLHYYVVVLPRKWLQLHYCWFFIITVHAFVSWMVSFSYNPHSTFASFNVMFLWAVLLLLHDARLRYEDNSDRFIHYHVRLFTIASVMNFFNYLISGGYPWIIIVTLYFTLYLVIHWCYHYYYGNWFKMHLSCYIVFQTLLFCIWCTTHLFVPWFLFPMVIWGSFVYLHYVRHDRNVARETEQKWKDLSMIEQGEKNAKLMDVRAGYDTTQYQYSTKTDESAVQHFGQL